MPFLRPNKKINLMNIFHDQLNRRIELAEPPTRIVSLVPSQTELLVDLGLREQIVGVTKFCVHPKELRKEKKVVGGTKKVHFDVVERLKPDIILCNKEENTEEIVKKLEKIAPVHVSDIETIDHAVDLISQYGDIFHKKKEATLLSKNIVKERADFVKDASLLLSKKVAYFIWKNPYMVAGKNTFINHLLELNQLENIFLDKDSRYPEINPAELREKEVDLILLSSEPYPFKEKHKHEFQNMGDKCDVYLVDGEYFSWYGSRLLAAFDYFRGLQSKFWSS